MLHNIRTHLAPNESIQSQIEQESAAKIDRVLKRNRLAFRTYANAALNTIESSDWNNIGVFSNLNGETNLVDFTNGQTLYGLNPRLEIEQQFEQRQKHLVVSELDATIPAIPQALPYKVECLVLLGLGLGYHVEKLIEQHQISHLIIYEPQIAYAKGSLLSADWQAILKNSASKNTTIYFQLGSNASNLISDVQELVEHFSIRSFCVYQHYNNYVFDAITGDLRKYTYNELCSNGIGWAAYQTASAIRPQWTHLLEPHKWKDVCTDKDAKFLKNIDAFKRYFPDIAEQFREHEPQRWKPIKNESEEINLCSIEYGDCFCGQSPQSDGAKNYESFANFPNKDGLVLGYDGEKLKSYSHYRFVNATADLLNELEEKQGSLPDDVQALILFGLTQGYQLDALLERHTIENLFICEPEPDFFFASLFALDWHTILEKIDKGERRIYINIGDRGENLFRDLISQFYAIGPYVLVNTFFYQSYFRNDLVDAVSQLREQLQVVIAMGECYDHARYGIAHTTELCNRGTHFLVSNSSTHFSDLERETPIFIVGNGPSIDPALEVIKEERDKVIVVSCGTSLQVLHKNGITPDFHAEIEQNRATFDWVARVGDFEYLKRINLISCNGIHPDTCDLFNEVFLAFKEGESSTVSAQKLVGSGKWATLTYAFPTVTNFVINLFIEMKFSQIYLFGVDLGFVSAQNHHSKFSGYYDDSGKEMYDYEEKNNTTLYVPGNFREVVATKYEFKVAKEIMEQSLASSEADCFNCADGALIAGATPLTIDSVLISSSANQKRASMEAMVQKAFSPIWNKQEYSQAFNKHFIHQSVESSLNQILAKIDGALTGDVTISELITQQKTLMFDSYQSDHSLLFYLLYGSSNYANALFTKLAATESVTDESSIDSETLMSPYLASALNAWKDMLENVKGEYIAFPDAFDFAYSMNLQREIVYLKKLQIDRGVLLIGKSTFLPFMRKYVLVNLPHANIVDSHNEAKHVSILAIFEHPEDKAVIGDIEAILDLANNTVEVILGGASKRIFESLTLTYPKHTFSNVHRHLPIRESEQINQWVNGDVPYSTDKMMVGWMCRLIENKGFQGYLVPKVSFSEKAANRQQYLREIENTYVNAEIHLDFPSYVLVSDVEINYRDHIFDTRMNRARPILGGPQQVTFDLPALSTKKIQDICDRFTSGDIVPIDGEIISA